MSDISENAKSGLCRNDVTHPAVRMFGVERRLIAFSHIDASYVCREVGRAL